MTEQLYFEDVEEGREIPTLVKRPTTRQLVKFAGATSDYYQIHYDREFALSFGLPDVIVHGPLKNAFLGQLMTDWMGEYGTLRELSVQFRGMDIPGTPVYAKGVVSKKHVEDGENLVECDIWLETHEGERTTLGHAVVELPSRRA
ncbi:MAG: dehydratase [Chloroflexi bacterium]|nr:dehydratase [Chloroflexota bacterium]